MRAHIKQGGGERSAHLLMLLVLTFGPFQVLLDKGEEDDWFQSHFIVALAATAAVSLLVGIARELYQKRPDR
jgi:DHA2 family multidrug resistance protein